ncbi:MAG: anaerobic ribonucleoside triphosphate reductase, partial [Paludibacteraceae bacterium]|nr:anaerobic ribonucleoside triphosphate reductase [Paludibacteraceae bacterium]
MDLDKITIEKRDGKHEAFSKEKIKNAITKAYRASDVKEEPGVIDQVTDAVCNSIDKEIISVEEIQDLVEHELMFRNHHVAKKYILYRDQRNTERHKRTHMKHVMDGIVNIEKNDVNLSNANMSSHTPAGQMMTFASEVTKDYAIKYLLSPKFARAHKEGDIHIHDLDYYPTKTVTCVQYDLEDIFERGFKTKNGSIRTPQSIRSYATLATIVFQTNQNEQHGGQSIPAFDFFMAPGVYKTFIKSAEQMIKFLCKIKHKDIDFSFLRDMLKENIKSIDVTDEEKNNLVAMLSGKGINITLDELSVIVNNAYDNTRNETLQAMEGLVHNLNTMHSRGGNQVVFSSINYGTDFSPEGRMVMRELLNTTSKGLGSGEVPVFPIQIFKVRDGISYSEEDYKNAIENWDAAMAGEIKFKAPNFDLLLKACATTATSLFPNFLFLDTPYNKHEKWDINDPKRYRYELATMGCRTRVFENLNGEKTSIGRGNLSFTSINLPRLAIMAKREAEDLYPDGDKHLIRKEAKKILLKKTKEMVAFVADQLYERYLYQRTALARQFPFMMGNDVWKGGAALAPND